MNIKKEHNSNSIIQAMNSLFTASKDSQLDDLQFENVNTELSLVMNYLNLNHLQAILFCNVCILKMTGKNTDVSEISKYLNLSSIEFLPYKDDLESLIKSGLLIRKHNRRYYDDFIRSKSYSINENLIHAIIHNLPCPSFEEKATTSTIDVLETVHELIKQTIDDELEKFELHKEVKELLSKNKHLPVMAHLSNLDIKVEYVTLLFFLIWKSLSGNTSQSIDEIIDVLNERGSDKIKMTQAIMSGNDPLSKLDFIELKEGRFMSDLEVGVTEKVLEILKLENISIHTSKNKNQRTLTPNEIVHKKLFFNSEEAAHVGRIENVLIEENYQAIIRRLQSSGMSPGVNILFHGAPGTGKTESVLQIAKATGREIMKVEISQTKSMWFGESEKIIKRIFKNYEILQKQLKSTPILFFNEADAILGKRKSVDSGNTAQTENAIQNILLEELENFKGIFMATTNLTNNLDKAFDRRFLFKVEFKNPSIEAAANIWKSKLPFLKKKDALFLAEKFPFSGGQIDNIAKKSEIEFVLNNKRPSLSEISTYCHSEDLSKKENTFGKIGF
jgi:hypothetical protein